jgi:glycosyltransferase involved in cell wall biosynthesis
MKFVVEAMGLTVGGGKRVGVNLLSELPAHTRHQFVLLIPDLPEYGQIQGPNIKAVRRPVPKPLLGRHKFLSRTVPEFCRDEHADAFLGLGNFVPRKLNCPAVVLLHNPHLVYREPLGRTRLKLRERLIVAYGRYYYRHLPAATYVVVQTQLMKQHLCARFGTDTSRVTVIPPGPLNLESDVSNGETSDVAPAVRRTFTFLCLSRYYAHKNIEILPAAMMKLAHYTSVAAQCLITISPDQHPRAAALLKTLSPGGPANRVVNIGPVPPDRIAEVYGSADAYILPTLLETYSLCYDEAWHFGVPILTSDRDFARERCQDAALYFDPLDADSVARAMARMMEDADLRQGLVENGRRILAQAPTWDDIAARFVQVLERTAKGEPPFQADSESQHEAHPVRIA